MSASGDSVAVEDLEAREHPTKTVEELEQQIQELKDNEQRLIDEAEDVAARHAMDLMTAKAEAEAAAMLKWAADHRKILDEALQKKIQKREEARIEKEKRIEAERKVKKLKVRVEKLTREKRVLEEEQAAKRRKVPLDAHRLSTESPPIDPSGALREVSIQGARQMLSQQTSQMFGKMNLGAPMSPPPILPPLDHQEAHPLDLNLMVVGDEEMAAAPMNQIQMDLEDMKLLLEQLARCPPYSFTDGLQIMEKRFNQDKCLKRIYSDPRFGRRDCLWDPRKDKGAAQRVCNVSTACNLFQSWCRQNQPGTSKKDVGNAWRTSEKDKQTWQMLKAQLDNEQKIQRILNVIEVQTDGRYRQK